jgi:hypothetical protein
MKALRSFETPRTTYPTRQRHIAEEIHNPRSDNPLSHPVNVLTSRRNKPQHPCKPNSKFFSRILKPGIAQSVQWLQNGLDGPGFESRQRRDIIIRPHRLWGYPSRTYRGTFPGVKRPGREVYHSLPSSAEVKNEWSSTPTTHRPTCLGQGKALQVFW